MAASGGLSYRLQYTCIMLVDSVVHSWPATLQHSLGLYIFHSRCELFEYYDYDYDYAHIATIHIYKTQTCTNATN